MLFAFTVGCTDPNSPKGVYEAFCDAAEAGDKAALTELIHCENDMMKAMIVEGLLEASKEMKEDEGFARVMKVEENGDTATLTLDNGNTMDCKKIDGKWKICINK